MRCPRRVPLGLMLVLGLAPAASAQEWHEAYRNGLAALARGQAARAVELFELAIQKGPDPGRNVVTYGTNVEERYYPYLRLAEAHMLLGNLDRARDALKRSEARNKEPPEERARIAALIAAVAEKDKAPAPAPSASEAPPIPRPDAETLVAPSPGAELPKPSPSAAISPPPALAGAASTPPGATSTSPAAALSAVPRVAGPVTGGGPLRTPAPAATPEPGTGTQGTGASLVIFSDPPGASVFLDDEPFGSTDPVSGRWVKNGVTAGRHQLRLTAPRYQDLLQELEVTAGGPTHFRGALAANPTTNDGRTLAAIGLFVFLAGLAISAWVWRSRSRPAGEGGLRGVLARSTSGWRSQATPVRPGVRSGQTPPRTPLPGSPIEPAERFGDYLLVEVLGRGGMAAVYRAERRGDVCALKRPLPGLLDDPEFLERFLREAELGRTLHHPNIVRILERGEVDHTPYFTMELVPGETLTAVLRRRGSLAPREATSLVADVAEALDYAHLKGVVHRDLKPSNVMVSGEGLVKVMDYGIARARRFEGLTITGGFLGTPEYVAPETVEGLGTDARSDLYSLGVVFYEVLTGRKPFVGDTPYAALRRHLTEEPIPPSAVNPAVPPELEAIVLRLMRKEPAQRYAAAEDLLVALRDYLNRAA